MKYGERHELLIKRSAVYFVTAQIVHEVKGAVEAVMQDEGSQKSCVQAEGLQNSQNSHKPCVRPDDSQNPQSHAYEQEIHTKFTKFTKVNAYEQEIHTKFTKFTKSCVRAGDEGCAELMCTS